MNTADLRREYHRATLNETGVDANPVTQFEVTSVPQIPNIGFFMGTGGGTSERGADSATAHARGISGDSLKSAKTGGLNGGAK